ncbi:MAG: helix-turn-helix domain-containing protein [Bacteroidetes bacterium]|nr:helix-turn-helix domain-containing protein [Bacteroidota bacterium]MBP9883838.1 helix-turn-helix domain-containing protein [Chitinophagales bacterium]
MKVICLEEAAFFELIEQVVTRLKEQNSAPLDKWISDDEAMRLLNVKSKTTLQKLRDEGKIRFTQPQKKIILYDRQSIETYLENNAKNIF